MVFRSRNYLPNLVEDRVIIFIINSADIIHYDNSKVQQYAAEKQHKEMVSDSQKLIRYIDLLIEMKKTKMFDK